MNYVGLRWYKCDFHLHTMSSECYEADDTVEAWVDEVEHKGIDCIAVTDHNDYRMIDAIKEEANQRGIIVFPGVEVTCDTTKIHVLVIFDTDRTSDDVRDYLTSIGIPKRAVENNEVTSESIFSVCEKAKNLGCIVIPAHIDELNGLYSMSDANIKKLFGGQYIDAVQVVNSKIWESEKDSFVQCIAEKYNDSSITDAMVDLWHKVYNKAKEANIPMIMSSDNPSDEHSAKHGLWGIGKDYSWIKMGELPNIEGLRQAFLSYKERLRTSVESEFIPERTPEFWIKSITVNGASINPYKDISVDFNTQLNTIIGGRGSGKSSIIRFITGVLRSAKFDDLENIKAEQDSFYQVQDKNGKGVLLENTSVEVLLYRNGVLYKITESVFKKKNSSFEIHKFNDVTKNWDIVEEEEFIDFLLVDAYTQKQIYELAQTPDALSKLIDKDNEELVDLIDAAEAVHKDLIDKIKELRITKEKIQDEVRLNLALKDINTQIDDFKKSGITDAIEQKTKCEAQKKDIDSYIANIKRVADEIAEWVNKEHISSPLNEFPDDIKTILDSGKKQVEVCILDIKENGERIFNQYEALRTEIDNSNWYKEYQKAINDYNEAKNKLNAQNLEATKLDELLERQKVTKQEIANIAELKQSIVGIEKDISKLETAYNTELNKVRNCRKDFVESILHDNNDVKIEYIEKANIKSVEDLLLRFVQNPGATVMDDIEKIAEETVTKGGIKKFREVIKKIINGEEVKGYSSYFHKSIRNLDLSLIDQIFAFVPSDELCVSYRNPLGKFVPLVTASPGQKTTAILTFILAYGNRPLLLDQPEDDLDNRLVYDLVVKQLKESKKHRQIIVVTHNANIPVNGDAEYITAMDSSSRYVSVKDSGTMDKNDIREEICDVMEGTEYAFKMRAKKYHLK